MAHISLMLKCSSRAFIADIGYFLFHIKPVLGNPISQIACSQITVRRQSVGRLYLIDGSIQTVVVVLEFYISQTA